MSLRPIKKITINNLDITNDDLWQRLVEQNKKPEFYALTLYIDGAYPTYLINEVEKRYGKQNIVIVPSNHNKYKKERVQHPEWFEPLSKVRKIKIQKLNLT